ncbi:MAG: hypothetical protein HYR96_04740, partial [Deltaproteobacteria bacterium]|nr:hypothetical protein [Deltaproteobacteria bacterium]
MTLLSQFSIGLVAFCAISLFAAAPTSKFESLLKGADLFGVPKDVKKVMRLGELYEAISVKGVKIRQGREDYNSALDAYRTKYNTLNFP